MSDPIALLPDFTLEPGTPAAEQALARGLRTFHAVARHVWLLPYGRTADRADPFLVLAEGRGTCSTKHGFLATLAAEHGAPVEQMLGIYLMSEANTPGIGPVLERHGLTAIPEAHSYLRAAGQRVDLTHPPAAVPGEPIEAFLHEEVITPDQVRDYKTVLHRQFIAQWLTGPGTPSCSAAELWAIREACIAALSVAA